MQSMYFYCIWESLIIRCALHPLLYALAIAFCYLFCGSMLSCASPPSNKIDQA